MVVEIIHPDWQRHCYEFHLFIIDKFEKENLLTATD